MEKKLVRAADRLFRRAVPVPLIKGPALYFLMRGNVVVYVGQASNVLNRLGAHTSWPIVNFDEIRIARVLCDSKSDLNDIEQVLIARFDPEGNRTKRVYRKGVRNPRLIVAKSIRSPQVKAEYAHKGVLRG